MNQLFFPAGLLPLFILGGVLRAASLPDPTLYCRYTVAPVTINGHLNEWGDIGKLYGRIDMIDPDTGRKQADRNRIMGRALWDPQYLYLAFFIRDTRLMGFTYQNNEVIADDDCMELFLDAGNDGGKKLNGNDYHVLFGINGNVTEKKGVDQGVAGKVPQKMSSDLDIRSAVRVMGTVNDNRDSDSGYAVEIAITLASLGVDPLAPAPMRMEAAVGDLDYNEGEPGGTTAYFMTAATEGPKVIPVPDRWRPFVFEGADLPAAGGAGTVQPARRLKYWILSGTALLLLICAGAVLLFISHRRSAEVRTKLRNEIDFKIRSFIDEHFKAKISLEEFCRQYNLSLRQVQRWLKQDLDATFNELLTKRRMKEARQMLESTEKTVSEICFEVGFNDSSYFTKIFRAAYGMAPTDLRKKG